MKKFVLVDSWGTWGYSKGQKVIDCTVKGCTKLAESNDYFSLRLPSVDTVYNADGTWHSYRVEKRAFAKRLGLH